MGLGCIWKITFLITSSMKSTARTCAALWASSAVKRPMPAPSSATVFPSYGGSSEITCRIQREELKFYTVIITLKLNEWITSALSSESSSEESESTIIDSIVKSEECSIQYFFCRSRSSPKLQFILIRTIISVTFQIKLMKMKAKFQNKESVSLGFVLLPSTYGQEQRIQRRTPLLKNWDYRRRRITIFWC